MAAATAAAIAPARAAVYIATSLDGYVARENHSLDWLPGAEPSAADASSAPPDATAAAAPVPDAETAAAPSIFDYDGFTATVDALLLGRATFDRVTLHLSPDAWAYAGKRVYVLTSAPLPVGGDAPTASGVSGDIEKQVELVRGHDVRFIDTRGGCDPTAIALLLASEGVKRVYVDGARTVQTFLRAGLVDDLVISTVPVLLGSGRSLFGPLAADVHLDIAASRVHAGMVQTHYRVKHHATS